MSVEFQSHFPEGVKGAFSPFYVLFMALFYNKTKLNLRILQQSDDTFISYLLSDNTKYVLLFDLVLSRFIMIIKHTTNVVTVCRNTHVEARARTHTHMHIEQLVFYKWLD